MIDINYLINGKGKKKKHKDMFNNLDKFFPKKKAKIGEFGNLFKKEKTEIIVHHYHHKANMPPNHSVMVRPNQLTSLTGNDDKLGILNGTQADYLDPKNLTKVSRFFDNDKDGIPNAMDPKPNKPAFKRVIDSMIYNGD